MECQLPEVGGELQYPLVGVVAAAAMSSTRWVNGGLVHRDQSLKASGPSGWLEAEWAERWQGAPRSSAQC
eukprot:2706038-Prorocentrum_lima.AAC.1